MHGLYLAEPDAGVFMTSIHCTMFLSATFVSVLSSNFPRSIFNIGQFRSIFNIGLLQLDFILKVSKRYQKKRIESKSHCNC